MAWSTFTAQGQIKQLSAASPLAPMIPISDTLLGSAQASITINLPVAYQHAEIRWNGRSDNAVTSQTLKMTFNGDTGANYDFQVMQAAGATPASSENFGQVAALGGETTGASAGASTTGSGTIELFDYASTTFHKSFVAHYGFKIGTAAGNVFIRSVVGWWRNTAAITSVTLTPNAGNFAAGSRFTVYGYAVTNPNGIGVGAFTPPTYGTTLPASPADGQQAILVDSTTSPTYQWLFRYNTGSAWADKWEYVGGADFQKEFSTAFVINTKTQVGASGFYRDTTTDLTAPRAGVYDVQCEVQFDPNGGAVGFAQTAAFLQSLTVGFGQGSTFPVVTAGQYISAFITQRLTGVAAGNTLGAAFASSVLGTHKVFDYKVRIHPVRVS
jgi:hypothetical protein